MFLIPRKRLGPHGNRCLHVLLYSTALQDVRRCRLFWKICRGKVACDVFWAILPVHVPPDLTAGLFLCFIIPVICVVAVMLGKITG